MIILAVMFVCMILLGMFTLMYQLYNLVYLDALSRGLKHPELWGILSLSGNNGNGGLLLYLIGRRKYPINMDEADKLIFQSRKKKAGLSLCFLAFGAIGLIFIALYGNIITL